MPERFVRALDVAAPVERLWAFHERPDALTLLSPPGERIEVIVPPRSLEVGTRVEVRAWLGPIPTRIVAEHVAYERGKMFADRMVKGPFRSWLHRHRFEPLAGGGSRLVDDIEYELPLGWVGQVLGAGIARRRLERMFEHRHRVTREMVENETKT
jgi:ligand-binding SRPBCC domain-containing protein